MQIFYEKKGAISVFLSVILLPMLIVALLATDGSKNLQRKNGDRRCWRDGDERSLGPVQCETEG